VETKILTNLQKFKFQIIILLGCIFFLCVLILIFLRQQNQLQSINRELELQISYLERYSRKLGGIPDLKLEKVALEDKETFYLIYQKLMSLLRLKERRLSVKDDNEANLIFMGRLGALGRDIQALLRAKNVDLPALDLKTKIFSEEIEEVVNKENFPQVFGRLEMLETILNSLIKKGIVNIISIQPLPIVERSLPREKFICKEIPFYLKINVRLQDLISFLCDLENSSPPIIVKKVQIKRMPLTTFLEVELVLASLI